MESMDRCWIERDGLYIYRRRHFVLVRERTVAMMRVSWFNVHPGVNGTTRYTRGLIKILIEMEITVALDKPPMTDVVRNKTGDREQANRFY